MKRIAVIILITLAMLGAADAAPVTTTTTYFTNTAFVATTGNWSNTFSGVAIVFDVAELNALTNAQSSNDVRAVMYNMLSYLYDQIQALDSTNRPANFTVEEGISMDSAATADIRYNHSVMTKQTISAFAIPSE